jgi:anaerobic magnesium-protoporphyrin IX monomethyl ester cyclase
MEYTPIRILLIYPPSTQTHQSCPMGLIMLAAVLEKAGMDVHILDSCAAKKRRSMKEIISYAADLKPDVIGITLLTPAVRESYKLAAGLKNQGFKLIAGGPHATLMPQEVIAHNFDAAVLGEGEPVIEQAVKALMGQISKDHVHGWVYKDENNKVVYTAPRESLIDLDSLPFPARHMIVPSDYGKSNEDVLHSNIFSSRGCPALCSFCAGGLFGKHFRFRSARNIIEEIHHIHTTYGTKNFHFVDDAMTVNRERIRALCEGLIELQMPITWSIMTRVDTINEDLLQLLSKAGCIQIDYGVESGHPETLKRIHKSHTIEMVRKIIPLTAKYKIKPFVFFILGFPWESADDIQVTFDLMKELSPYVEYFHPAIASIIIPFPGTEIYDKYKNEYGFENWWLSENRHYEQNGTNRQFYFEDQLFACGHVLKANFFNYNNNVKQKIYEVFTFMHKHNTQRHNPVLRFALNSLLSISKNTAQISPALEMALFAPIRELKKSAALSYKH